MAGCLGFQWAATYVETGLDAFNENIARNPGCSLGGSQPLSGILPWRLLAARSARLTPRDLSNLMARSAFGEYWRVHVILSFVLDSGISPEFTHKWKNAIFHSHTSLLFI